MSASSWAVGPKKDLESSAVIDAEGLGLEAAGWQVCVSNADA